MAYTEAQFTGATGLTLAASIYRGSSTSGAGARPVMLLHGGGQTRHSFDKTCRKLAATGFTAIAIDQRGHGDSEWAKDEGYEYSDFAADAATVAEEIARRYGRKPVSIGASLGGNSSLMACEPGQDAPFAGLVLVDVTPRMETAGLAAIHGFMTQHSLDGFVSVEAAAEAIAAYMPHRPKPRSLNGLSKNLRHRDGRYFWHWDPAFFAGSRPISADRYGVERVLLKAAAGLNVPTLLVRGRSSELVSEELAQEFLSLAPHAKYADIGGAHHMVAGDDNDTFSAAILSFLSENFSPQEA